MIGETYWGSSITLYCRHDPQQGWLWKATASFHDGFDPAGDHAAGQLSTLGQLDTLWIPGGPDHRAVPAVIDTVKDDAERLGIRWRDPALLFEPNASGRPAPHDGLELLTEQGNRLGWDS